VLSQASAACERIVYDALDTIKDRTAANLSYLKRAIDNTKLNSSQERRVAAHYQVPVTSSLGGSDAFGALAVDIQSNGAKDMSERLANN